MSDHRDTERLTSLTIAEHAVRRIVVVFPDGWEWDAVWAALPWWRRLVWRILFGGRWTQKTHVCP